MKKVLIVCGNGLGSSFIVEMNVKKILAEMNKEAEVAHTDLTSAKSETADLILSAKDIAEHLSSHSAKVVGLSNLLDNARHIGGQISSSDPFQYGEDCKPRHVNIDELASELDIQVTKYRGLGSGKNLIQHYVVSLAPGEKLTDKEWRKVVKKFMDELGYGNDTIYTACVHTEKDHEHAHIVACRVRHNGKLVPNKNDYAKAVSASRKIEKEFGLKITANPDQTMGVEPTRTEIELDKKGIKSLDDDPAVIIRKRIDTVFDAKKAMTQMTMSDFVNLLKEQGVQVKVKLNKEEQPIGINYSLDGNIWISGSKIKKTRTTWKALLATEMIDYKPFRDINHLEWNI